MQNFDWLEEKLGDVDDDYILFDCPGNNILFFKCFYMNYSIIVKDY